MSAVIILTYGKVCSSSLRQMLMEHFPGEVLYSHGLRSAMPRLVRSMAEQGVLRSSRTAAGFAENDAIERRLEQAARGGEVVTVVTGTRDPVARSLSVALHTLHTLHPDLVAHDAAATAENIATRLSDLWASEPPSGDIRRALAAATVRAPFDWFRDEIEELLGFDLRAAPFDVERGYVLFTRRNVRLLVFRMEDAPGAVEAGFSALFPGRSFALPRVNVTCDKADGDVYRELQRRFKLPDAVLDSIYGHPHVRCFLSAEDVQQAKARWSRPAPRSGITAVTGVLDHERWLAE